MLKLTFCSALAILAVSSVTSMTMVDISDRNSFAAEIRAALGSPACFVLGRTLTGSRPAPFFLTTSLACRDAASKRYREQMLAAESDAPW